MKTLLGMALGVATITAAAQSPSAPAAPAVEVHPVSSLPAVNGSNENFTGVARISAPFKLNDPGRAGGASVRFEARARTAWHTHPLGQTLIVTAGLGLVQQQGQPARVIRPGDVVTIPPNVRHWHGAGPDDAMTHVAIAEREGGISVGWQDKVSDEDYRAALVGAGLAAAGRAMPSVAARARPTSETLSARQQAIPLMAAFMASSDMPRLNAALNRGLDSGLTVSETKEVLVQLYAYAGFPKSLNALGELLKVVEARKQRGIQDAPGQEPGGPVRTGADLLAAGKANQTEISGGSVQGPVFDFAPVINQFLQAHLFGAIFERDNLDWQSRELATVGALAATRLPIVTYCGDNVPVTPTTERGQDNWRVRLAMARLWVDAVNRHGGDARLVHLPEVGIRGNTHFPMSDLNSVEITDLVSSFLAEKTLDL